MNKNYFFFILGVLLTGIVCGQAPVCPSPLIYFQTGSTIQAFNTALPISSTNPFSTGIPTPPGGGLTVMPNIHGGTLSPTFYSTGSGGTYYYWSGSAWVSSGATVNSGGVNLGGCGTAIYSILGNNVYVHTANTNSTTFVTTVATSVADLVPDCNCNFYIFSPGFLLKKYSPTGNLIATYTMTGLSGSVNGGGYAIVGNNVYCQVGSTLQIGTIGTGSIVSFVALTGTITGGSDWASCSVDLNSVPVTATIQSYASSCQNATLMATSNSAVTYSWSGPGVSGAQTASAIVTNSPGVFTCTVFSSGCGSPPTLSLSLSPGSNSCISVASASITCASLGSATVSAPGTGPFSFTWNPGAQVGPVATGLSPGTYTVTIYDAFFNLSYTASVTFNSLIPLTGSMISAPATCNGLANGSASVTSLSGGSGNQTYSWSNGVVTYTQPGTSSLSAGIWSLTVTDLLTACTFSQTFLINQPPPLTLNISTSTPSTCLGGSIALTGTASGGTSANGTYLYNWSGGPSLNTLTVSPISAGTYTYMLTATDQNSCAISDTASIDIVPPPVLFVTNVSICPLQVGNLNASGATSYTWSNNAGGSTLSDSPLATQEYTVTGTALGCTASTTGEIFVKPIPLITVTSNSTVCEGKPFLFGATGGTAYSWNGPLAFVSGAQNNNIIATQLNQSGIYGVTVTAANSCTASGNLSLTVNPLPLVSISPAASSLCAGNTNSITLTAGGNATLYSWLPNAGLSANNTQAVNANPGTTTVYTLTGSLNNCTATANATVFVVPPPVPNIILSTNSLCALPYNGSPNSVTLTAGGGISYTIDAPGHIQVVHPSGPVSPLTVQSPFTSGVTTITLSASNGVCTKTSTSNLMVIPNPGVTINNPAAAMCSGESRTLHVSGAAYYAWTFVNAATTGQIAGSSVVAGSSLTTVYSVYGGSLGCNSSAQHHTLTVNPLPELTVSPPNPTICLYKGILLTASGTASSYQWSVAPGIFQLNGASTMAAPLTQQVYTVTGELNNCFKSATTTVTVLALPEPTITTTQLVYCENETIMLNGEGGLIYEWRTPGNLYFQKKTVGVKLSNWQNATGHYSLTVTDKNGCQNTATTFVTVNPLPQGSLFGLKEEGCAPLCSDFNFKSDNLNISSYWTINEQDFPEQFSYCFNQAGTFTVSGNISDNTTGCKNVTEFKVNVYPRPQADFYYTPLHPVENLDEVVFRNTSITDDASIFTWFFNTSEVSQSGSENPRFLFTEHGEYPVVLMVSDKNKCADTIIKTVKVEPDYQIYVPNVFTPNGDELNDVFKPVTRSVKLYTLAVYDRWGQRIFYSTAPSTGWDGTFLGSECKSDVYSWQISLTTFSGEKKDLTGHVSLLR